MLKKETIEKLKSFVDVDKLIAAIKDDKEVDLDLPEVYVFTAEELSSREENIKAEGIKEGKKVGETIGKEFAVKEMKKAFGVDVDGKDLGKLVETVKTQLSKGDEGLKEQIKLLQKDLETKDGLIKAEQTKAQAAVREASLLSKLPQNKTKNLTNDEHLLLVKTNLEFTEEGVKYKGEVLRDPKTKSPLDEAKAIEHFYNDRKLVDVQADPRSGRGGGSSSTSPRPTTRTEAIAQWQAKNPGVSIMDPAFVNELKELSKNPEFKIEE